MDIRGSVTIITGSSSGLGAACAKMLAEKGSNLVINYSKSRAQAEEIAAACDALGVETLVAQADVASDDDCRRMVQAAIDKWGRIDALINNAGTTRLASARKLESLDAQDFHDIYAVNVIGPYQMIRAVAPHMQAAGHGSIVNISSVAGVIGTGSSIAYAASKGALNIMTKMLARSLGPEIRVNAVAPGMIQTPWWEGRLDQERYDKLVRNIERTTPLQVASSAEDIAETVVWFVYGAKHVTGEVFLVDAGLHLGAPTPVPTSKK